MNTPSCQPNGAALNYAGPSPTFLQQLLNEIDGRGTTATARKEPHEKRAAPSQRRPRAPSRRVSSIWIGGTEIARDAREKLRAADERRFRRLSAEGTDGAPDVFDMSSRSLASISSTNSLSSSVSSIDQSKPGGHSASAPIMRITRSGTACDSPTGNATYPHPRPMYGDFLTISPHRSGCSLWGDGASATPSSPLMFCDVDSDTSATPSPSEAPTSALTIESSNSSATDRTHSPTRYDTRSSSPHKRGRQACAQPMSTLKRVRTMTFPAPQCTYNEPEGPMPRTLRSIGSDNRRLIHHPACVERAPALPSSIAPDEPYPLPALSSFRPQATDSQGLPVTPPRASGRRSSMPQVSPSPEQAETPSFARSLHLVDMGVSVYKASHGEAWRENALCLYCFRKHGNFNRILTHGYEVCGGDEMLRSHYWEST